MDDLSGWIKRIEELYKHTFIISKKIIFIVKRTENLVHCPCDQITQKKSPNI